jgi:hypothetical protein
MSTGSTTAGGPVTVASGPPESQPKRAPITYGLETGGRTERCELPFVVGIFADLSGDRDRATLPVLRERRFVTVDRESFDAVLKQARRPSGRSRPRLDSLISGRSPGIRPLDRQIPRRVSPTQPLSRLEGAPLGALRPIGRGTISFGRWRRRGCRRIQRTGYRPGPVRSPRARARASFLRVGCVIVSRDSRARGPQSNVS